MPALEILLLGAFQVYLEGKLVRNFNLAKVQALLAYLAAESHQAHSRELLVGLLWPDQPETAARLNLRQTLLRLRQIIPPDYLLASRQTIQFDPYSPHRVDVTTFTQLITASQKHLHPTLLSCPSCIDGLQQAAALYRGDFLTELFLPDNQLFEEWALLKREWLRREVLQALYYLADAAEQQGSYDLAYRYAWRQVELDSLREEAHRQLMRALARQGRRSEALAQYETCRRVLADELGVEPAQETTALYEQIRAGELNRGENLPPSTGSGHSPLPYPPALPPTSRHNLPAQLTPLIGRQKELASLAQLLSNPDLRLMTILGPGGMGKTHLAIEAARKQLDQFPHGVYFVPLASLEGAETMVAAIAEALTFSFYPGTPPQQQLVDYLRQKRLLLVLDNFEHLLGPSTSPLREGIERGRDTGGGAVELVIDLLRQAPELKILVTSRARLNLQGEQLFPLEGIDFPHDPTQDRGDIIGYSAIQLFIQGARRLQPAFELAEEQTPAVAQLCRLMHGMPLGILLAAAWTETLSPTEIAAEISRSLDFLSSHWRDLPERQRTMRAVFDHSWRLLTARERDIFQQISVFRGGFTAEAAQAVTGASLQELSGLTSKSLLYQVEPDRYEIHELLRQYGAEKLAAQTAEVSETSAALAVRDRHTSYYCAFLQAREPDLKGLRQQISLAELELEHDNIWAAWRWAVEREYYDQLEQASESLGHFYDWRGRYREGQAAYRLAAQKLQPLVSDELRPLLARMLIWQASFSRKMGEMRQAAELSQESLSLLRQSELTEQDVLPEKAFALLERGKEIFYSDRQTAQNLVEQSLSLYRVLEDQWGTARALTMLGTIAWHRAAFAEAQQYLVESLAPWRILGDQRRLAKSLELLGRTLRHLGQLEECEQLQRESLSLLQGMGHQVGVAELSSNLGITLAWLGKFAEGQALLKQSLAIYESLGQQGTSAVATAIYLLSEIETYSGHYEQGRVHAQTALTIFRDLQDLRGIGFALAVLTRITQAEGDYLAAQQLGQEGVATLQKIEQPIPLGSILLTLGWVARSLGELHQARRCLAEVLQITLKFRSYFLLHLSFALAASLVADQGQRQQAVEYYALASSFPYIANSRWFEDVAGRYITAVAATLPPEVVTAAQERGKARDVWETARELLAELEVKHKT